MKKKTEAKKMTAVEKALRTAQWVKERIEQEEAMEEAMAALYCTEDPTAGMTEEEIEELSGDKPISLRINKMSYALLLYLAEEFRQTKGGLGGDLLEAAILDVFNKVNENTSGDARKDVIINALQLLEEGK